MKKNIKYLVIASVLIIAIVSFYFFLYLPTSGSKAVDVLKLKEQPPMYMNLSEQQLNLYPPLRQALNSGHYVDVPNKEWNELFNLLETNDFYIKYNGSYYRVNFITP
jgi:hypothetical protein